MDKFLVFIEALDDGKNTQLLETVVQGYVMTHCPEILNEGFADRLDAFKQGYQKMANEGSGAIRRGIGAAAIAAPLAFGAMKMTERMGDQNLDALNNKITQYEQLEDRASHANDSTELSAIAHKKDILWSQLKSQGVGRNADGTYFVTSEDGAKMPFKR